MADFIWTDFHCTVRRKVFVFEFDVFCRKGKCAKCQCRHIVTLLSRTTGLKFSPPSFSIWIYKSGVHFFEIHFIGSINLLNFRFVLAEWKSFVHDWCGNIFADLIWNLDAWRYATLPRRMTSEICRKQRILSRLLCWDSKSRFPFPVYCYFGLKFEASWKQVFSLWNILQDALALVRLDDLFVESFEISDGGQFFVHKSNVTESNNAVEENVLQWSWTMIIFSKTA